MAGVNGEFTKSSVYNKLNTEDAIKNVWKIVEGASSDFPGAKNEMINLINSLEGVTKNNKVRTIECIRNSRSLSGFLSTVTAFVTGIATIKVG